MASLDLYQLPWNRYWIPRGGMVDLDWWGFLRDPQNDPLPNPRGGLIRANELASTPYVVYLGEPGMGKSFELRRLFEGSTGARNSTLFRDLRQYDSTEALRRDVFDCDVFRSWVAGEDELTLALDSMDEALLEINVLATWLIEQFQRLPYHRLRLRIASRTARWPQIMEQGPHGIWRGSDFGVYELAPLTLGNVRVAAVAHGVNPEAFLAEVSRRAAAPLASKPTTLGFLLNSYRRDQAFPSTQAELYRLGCLNLCDEDEERRLSGRADAADFR